MDVSNLLGLDLNSDYFLHLFRKIKNTGSCCVVSPIVSPDIVAEVTLHFVWALTQTSETRLADFERDDWIEHAAECGFHITELHKFACRKVHGLVHPYWETWGDFQFENEDILASEPFWAQVSVLKDRNEQLVFSFAIFLFHEVSRVLKSPECPRGTFLRLFSFLRQHTDPAELARLISTRLPDTKKPRFDNTVSGILHEELPETGFYEPTLSPFGGAALA